MTFIIGVEKRILSTALIATISPRSRRLTGDESGEQVDKHIGEVISRSCHDSYLFRIWRSSQAGGSLYARGLGGPY